MPWKVYVFFAIFWSCYATKNLLPDVQSDESECSRRMNYLSDYYFNTQIIFPPQLTGKWLSERCEVRTGPQYVLRSYTFYPNNTFYLLQFFYTDDSCSSISHVVSIKGSYKRKDVLSSKVVCKVDRVTVTPHDHQFINSLPSNIRSDCVEMTGKYWKTFKEYVIFEPNQKTRDLGDDNLEPLRSTSSINTKSTKQMNADLRCLSSMNISFDELSTLRVQKRPAIDNKNIRYELLLGSLHPYPEKGRKEILLKFQLPLILLNETSDCPICNLISTKNHMHVPHLTARPTLPLYFNGEWISQTCEPRSQGLHTLRTYRFNLFETSWELETKYYSNFACTNLLMVHNTVGHYSQGSISRIVSGATEIDFSVNKSYLTIADQAILDNVEIDQQCGGAYYWKLNVKKEIPSKGCSSIALANPVLRYDIIKLDMDYEGSYILLLGDEGSADTESNQFIRPTAYEYPLVQCDSEPQDFPDLNPTPSSATGRCLHLYLVVVILLVYVKLS